MQIATVSVFALRYCTATLPPHAPCRLQRNTTPSCGCSTATLPPHAPCRLQHKAAYCLWASQSLCLHTLRADCNAQGVHTGAQQNLCLHTLRADCNADQVVTRTKVANFASTRSVQIATDIPPFYRRLYCLCLHTLRADCNKDAINNNTLVMHFASTRSVQIATVHERELVNRFHGLCLHTLRADCNRFRTLYRNLLMLCLHTLRADCNYLRAKTLTDICLCLHTLRADCNCRTRNGSRNGCRFASTRSVQIATSHASVYNTLF